MSLYIIDIHGEIEGDYEIIGKYEAPRKGHWIFDGDCLICGKCKKAYTFSGSNFCPNCGADMREVEE